MSLFNSTPNGTHREKVWRNALWGLQQGPDTTAFGVKLNDQPLLAALLHELEISTSPFEPYNSPPPGEQHTSFKVEKDEEGLSALELLRKGLERILGGTCFFLLVHISCSVIAQ